MQLPKNVSIAEKSQAARFAAWYMRSPSVAMVWGNTILLWGVEKEKFVANSRWLKHELKHVEQYQQYGKINFLRQYLWEWIRHGYTNNRFEIEARAAENIT